MKWYVSCWEFGNKQKQLPSVKTKQKEIIGLLLLRSLRKITCSALNKRFIAPRNRINYCLNLNFICCVSSTYNPRNIKNANKWNYQYSHILWFSTWKSVIAITIFNIFIWPDIWSRKAIIFKTCYLTKNRKMFYCYYLILDQHLCSLILAI